MKKKNSIISEATSLFERIIDEPEVDDVEVEEEYDDDVHIDVRDVVKVIDEYKSTLRQGNKKQELLSYVNLHKSPNYDPNAKHNENKVRSFVGDMMDDGNVDVGSIYDFVTPLQNAIKNFDFETGSNRINNFKEYLTTELMKEYEGI